MGCSHNHHHHNAILNSDGECTTNEKRLFIAILANVVLTLAQIVGGLISGSLSLVADAVHNLSDAAALWIAWVAVKIGRKPADTKKTFGYKRAETIAALINLVTLVVISLFLVYQSVERFITPEPIGGWIVIGVAGVALLVDLLTAALTYRQAKTSMNMRAAFLHNLADALASVGVIVSGALIVLYGWVWTDAFITFVIAAFILFHSVKALPQVIHLLMDGAPNHIDINIVIETLEKVEGVTKVHHVHIRQLDEQRNALEAHVMVTNGSAINTVKHDLKVILIQKFSIIHSTLEFELTDFG